MIGTFKRLLNKKDLSILAVCFVLACIFWLLNALSNVYNSSITITATYYNFPENKFISNKLPTELKVSVNALGRDIVLHKLKSTIDPLEIDVAEYIEMSDDGNSGFIITSILANEIAKKFNLKVKDILNVYPERLQFSFEKFHSKKVPVKLDAEINFAAQHTIKGKPEIVPDSIVVTGPLSEIKDIYEWRTQPVDAKNLSKSLVKEVPLHPPKEEQINLSHDKVKVTILVELLTQDKKRIPVTISNLPDTIKVKVVPESVQLTYQVPLSMFDSVTTDMFRIDADFSEIDIKKEKAIKLTLTSQPVYVTNVRFKPKEVTYFIQK